MNLRLLLIVVLSFSFIWHLPMVGESAQADLEEIEAKIEKQFPGVRSLTTSELAKWLGAKEQKQPLILDVRSAKEYEVSHLRGALRAEKKSDLKKLAGELPKDTPIVTYCSVGYRSARAAKRLKQLGFQNVYNLKGSLFRWANEGRELVSGSEPADKAHPYSDDWAHLLKDDLVKKENRG